MDNVTAAIALSHQAVSDARVAGVEAANVARIPDDIADWSAPWVQDVARNADFYTRKGLDVSSCTTAFEQQLRSISAQISAAAEKIVHRDFQDAVDTATKADSLADKAEVLLRRAQEEAAKPDGQYGPQVQAILKDAADLASRAKWNNDHIRVVLSNLKLGTYVVTNVYTDPRNNAEAITEFALFCMRQLQQS